MAEPHKADGNMEKSANALENASFRMCTPTIRPSSFNTSNPYASQNKIPTIRTSSFNVINPFASQNKIAKGILKPPQLNVNNITTNSKPFLLKPSQLNPFSYKSENLEESEKKPANVENGEPNNRSIANGDMPKFVPLVETKSVIQTCTTTKEAAASTTATSKSNSFVFGQNLKERIVADEKKEESKASTSVNSNGGSEMLFTSAIKNEVVSDPSTKEKETKSLSESAREYEESRAVKRKYDEVEVITGEEDENNILKISCKLFAFDKNTSSWQERGRGTLRLNDFEAEDNTGSRLVFRTAGSLRVILNTKIWAEMTVDKASDKSIRLTALDGNGEVKVFLIMSSIDDSNKLFILLKERLEQEIWTQKRKKLNTANDLGGAY